MIRPPHHLEATLAVLIGLAITTVGVARMLPGGLLGKAVLLSLAALKGRKILLDYLDLRAAPALWRGLVSAWVFSVAAFALAASTVGLLV
ncbi:cytochrome C oxidase subunit IV family protein [Bradyrhizobium sp. ARR65]|uniref:cytochrome C oxidase subunit IV family protein n=1 Tax=Bradyrhizobium sp. ARR65 TaxID=1040989 RepID=UPI0004642FBE|nr:cytochrome C oxidase subunit IV family protein [Bradyrhizobium sp. ARR65]